MPVIAELNLGSVWPAFVISAIEQQGSIKELAKRWGRSVEGVSNWRDGKTEPTLQFLLKAGFSDQELLAVLRMIGRERVKVELVRADQGQEKPEALTGMTIDTLGKAFKLQEQIHDSESDGKIDADEMLGIDARADALIASVERVRRHSRLSRLLGIFRRKS